MLPAFRQLPSSNVRYLFFSKMSKLSLRAKMITFLTPCITELLEIMSEKAHLFRKSKRAPRRPSTFCFFLFFFHSLSTMFTIAAPNCISRIQGSKKCNDTRRCSSFRVHRASLDSLSLTQTCVNFCLFCLFFLNKIEDFRKLFNKDDILLSSDNNILINNLCNL